MSWQKSLTIDFSLTNLDKAYIIYEQGVDNMSKIINFSNLIKPKFNAVRRFAIERNNFYIYVQKDHELARTYFDNGMETLNIDCYHTTYGTDRKLPVVLSLNKIWQNLAELSGIVDSNCSEVDELLKNTDTLRKTLEYYDIDLKNISPNLERAIVNIYDRYNNIYSRNKEYFMEQEFKNIDVNEDSLYSKELEQDLNLTDLYSEDIARTRVKKGGILWE